MAVAMHERPTLVITLVFECHLRSMVFAMKNNRREQGAEYDEMGNCKSKLNNPVATKVAKKTMIPIPTRYIELDFLSIKLMLKLALSS
jgi:hypothetical protein